MYLSVYYDHSSYTYYLLDDEIGEWQSFKYTPTYWKRIPKYQEGAKPILTGGWAKPVKKLNKEDPNLLEKDINKELVLLRDLYYKFDDVIPQGHRIVYFDIETQIGGALTPEFIKSAPMPFTSLALKDVTTNQYVCFIIDESGKIQEINQNGKHIIPCKTEKELFQKFLDKWEEFDPTIVTGWNSEYFDIPYLYYRILQVLGEEEVLRLSPIRKIRAGEFMGENQVKIGGINHLDYMLIFKKYIVKQESSYKLGDIGLKYVNLGKIEYEGNLNQLFKEDVNKFIEYNIRDVEILEKLEEKLRFIELTIVLCHDCCIPYEQVYYTTVLNEGKILKYLKRKDIVSNNKPTTDNPHLKNQEKQDYAGGFLLSPKIGVSFWGADFDASSHYPTIIMSLNIGAETLVGWIENDDKYNCWLALDDLKNQDPNTYVNVINKNGKSKEIKIGKLIDVIEENKYTISASGAIFDTSRKSILAEILEDGFNKRQELKKLMKKSGKDQNWEKYKFYEIRVTAMKYFINGCYGALALPSFRYSDGKYILSKATTLSGQRLCMEVIREMNSYMTEDFKR